ncbi:hypothetical protein [Serratia symbiotica]|uniref:hypothetical protein n=1 Tax=Serratia symbiotica TaxID=138074 RepID=UPI0013266A18|nr:hypothetical protein [Serratia symbiotica]QTP13323.1 hypothetical protein GPZ83_0000360 [Serratia symbiotica]
MKKNFIGSSWGRDLTEPNIKALKKFNSILKTMNSFLERTDILIKLCVFLTIALLLFSTTFEDVILDDGTSNICVINGKTGEIEHVLQK